MSSDAKAKKAKKAKNAEPIVERAGDRTFEERVEELKQKIAARLIEAYGVESVVFSKSLIHYGEDFQAALTVGEETSTHRVSFWRHCVGNTFRSVETNIPELRIISVRSSTHRAKIHKYDSDGSNIEFASLNVDSVAKALRKNHDSFVSRIKTELAQENRRLRALREADAINREFGRHVVRVSNDDWDDLVLELDLCGDKKRIVAFLRLLNGNFEMLRESSPLDKQIAESERQIEYHKSRLKGE